MKPTNQSVLDEIVKVFIFNKTPRSVDEIGNCVYDDYHNGHGCAIGCVMPTEMKRSVDSGMFIETLISGRKDVAEYFENCNVNFLKELQIWHDSADRMELFSSDKLLELKMWANEFQLEWKWDI